MQITSPIEPVDVENPIAGLPNLNTKQLTLYMRVDQSIGLDRLEMLITDSFDEVNRQLETFIAKTVEASPPVELTKKQNRTYIRAVLYETSARLSELYVDYDTASSGRTRDEKQVDIVNKPQRMRREVQHCIAILRNISANRVRLL